MTTTEKEIQVEVTEEFTEREAMEFFAAFYGGNHHIPGFKVKPYGRGWCVNHDRGCLSTFDFSELTTLVFMAHQKCIRVEVSAIRTNILRIALHKRKREGSMSERHPTIEKVIDLYKG